VGYERDCHGEMVHVDAKKDGKLPDDVGPPALRAANGASCGCEGAARVTDD
jgi:hypothetical protein